MKTTMIRAFVVALALTGGVATVHSTSTRLVADASHSNMPIPLCPPSDPQGCGIR